MTYPISVLRAELEKVQASLRWLRESDSYVPRIAEYERAYLQQILELEQAIEKLNAEK